MKAILVIDIDEKYIGAIGTEIQIINQKYNCKWKLKPMPERHGDLIDRQALIDNGIKKGFCDWYDEIKMADTIIEADRGETE